MRLFTYSMQLPSIRRPRFRLFYNRILRLRLWSFRVILLSSALAFGAGSIAHLEFKADVLWPHLYYTAIVIFGHHLLLYVSLHAFTARYTGDKSLTSSIALWYHHGGHQRPLAFSSISFMLDSLWPNSLVSRYLHHVYTQCHLMRTTADIVIFIHQRIPHGGIPLKPWHSSLFVTATCSVYILLISLAFWCLLGLYWTLFIARWSQNKAEFALRFQDDSPRRMINNLVSILISNRLWGDLYE